MIRLLLDEDAMATGLVQALRVEGFDVTTILEHGRTGRADADQIAFSAAEGRTIYSFNVSDFARLHTAWMREGQHHAGIIVVVDRLLPLGEQVRCLVRLLRTLSADDMIDRLEYLGSWG